MNELPLDALPQVTPAEMRETDRIMVEDLHIDLVQMMENAGRSLAELAPARFAPNRVVVLAGTGGNGGVAIVSEPSEADLVIDALIGYGLHGAPGGRTAKLIQWANSQQCPVLALDVPSGVDATSGQAGRPCVRTAATLTLGLPKTGLRDSPEVGELYLADISVPTSAYRVLGLEVPVLFCEGAIVRLLRLADLR